LSWCNNQFFCCQSSGRSLHTFSSSCGKSHSSLRNWLFDLPGRIFLWTILLMSKKMMSMHLTSLFICLASFVSAGLDFFRDFHNIWCILALVSIAKSHQERYTTPNKRMWKIGTFTQLCDILYTDSQNMVVLSPTVASRYCNCCIDGSTSPANYGYPLAFQVTQRPIPHCSFCLPTRYNQCYSRSRQPNHQYIVEYFSIYFINCYKRRKGASNMHTANEKCKHNFSSEIWRQGTTSENCI
jgi:hypothetical protein